MRSQPAAAADSLVVAVLLAAVVLLGGCASAGPRAADGSGSAARSSSAPASTTTSSASVSSSGTTGTPSTTGGLQLTIPCRDVVLSATVTVQSGGAALLELTNTGTSACSASGYVEVRPATAAGTPVSGSPKARRVPKPEAPRRVVVPAKGHAYAGLLIEQGTACTSGTGVAVTPPVESRALTARVVDSAGVAVHLSACGFTVGPLRATAVGTHL